MVKDPFKVRYDILAGSSPKEKRKKKRKTLTASKRIYYWEHYPELSRKCNICHKRITRMSDLEMDHTRAHSKGGVTLAFAHRDCNRFKADKSLTRTQRMLGIKTKTRTTKVKSTKRRSRRTPGLFDNDYWKPRPIKASNFNPL